MVRMVYGVLARSVQKRCSRNGGLKIPKNRLLGTKSGELKTEKFGWIYSVKTKRNIEKDTLKK